mgnify:CR=1 FL=1
MIYYLFFTICAINSASLTSLSPTNTYPFMVEIPRGWEPTTLNGGSACRPERLLAEFNAVDLHEISRIAFWFVYRIQNEQPAGLGHRFNLQYARHNRFLGKMAGKKGFIIRNCLASTALSPRSSSSIRSTSRKGAR